jgi:hypothetical protein
MACDPGREATSGAVGVAETGSVGAQEGVRTIDYAGWHRDTGRIGVRTRGLDIKAGGRQAHGGPRRARRGGGRGRALESRARHAVVTPHTAALNAGTPWLDVFCPGCGTSRALRSL